MVYSQYATFQRRLLTNVSDNERGPFCLWLAKFSQRKLRSPHQFKLKYSFCVQLAKFSQRKLRNPHQFKQKCSFAFGWPNFRRENCVILITLNKNVSSAFRCPNVLRENCIILISLNKYIPGNKVPSAKDPRKIKYFFGSKFNFPIYSKFGSCKVVETQFLFRPRFTHKGTDFEERVHVTRQTGQKQVKFRMGVYCSILA